MLPAGLLWKYLGLNDSRKPRLNFLKDCCFRFTRPRYLNDLFELKVRIYIDEYSREDRDVARQEAINSGISAPEQLCDDDIEHLFLSSFPAHRFDEDAFPNLYPAILPALRQEPFHSIAEIDEFRVRKVQEDVQRIMNKAYGIFSLSEDQNSITMWSYYGAGHRGICVGFNPNHSFFHEIGQLKKIQYGDKPVSISSNGGIIRVAGLRVDEKELPPIDTLIRKYSKWEEEKEWRLIVSASEFGAEDNPTQASDSFFLLPFPESTISAVILGSRVTSDEEAEAISLLAKAQWRHIKLFRAHGHEMEYSLEFEEIVRSDGSLLN